MKQPPEPACWSGHSSDHQVAWTPLILTPGQKVIENFFFLIKQQTEGGRKDKHEFRTAKHRKVKSSTLVFIC